MSNSSAAGDSRQWQIFICYRQDDGKDAASWLHRQLHGFRLPFVPDGDQEAPTLSLYFDQTAPAVDDWTKIHRPALESSLAFLFVCSPAAQHRQGEEDWVHRELDWWLEHRKTAPIIVDPLDRGARYLPESLKLRWPNAQRVLVQPDAWKTLKVDERTETVERTVERILGGIRISAGHSRREDYERELARRRALQRQRKYLVAALVVAMVAIGGMVWLGQLARGRARSLRASAILGQAAVADEPLTRALLLTELDGSVEPENGRRLARDVAGSGVPVFALGIDGQRVDRVAVSADGRWLATSTYEGDIEVHPIDGQGQPIALDGHDQRVNHLAFSPDNTRLASASSDGHATIWSLDRSAPPHSLQHVGSVRWIAFRPGTDQVVTVSRVDDADADRLSLWSLDTGAPIDEVAVEQGVHRLWMSPTGHHLLTVSGYNGADLWPLAEGIGEPLPVVEEARVFPPGSSQGAFSPKGDRVAVACSNGTAVVYPTAGDGTPIVFDDYRQEVTTVAFSPSGEFILAGYLDGATWVWPLADDAGRPILLPGVGSSVRAASFLGNGTVVIGTYDGTVRVVPISSSLWEGEGYAVPLEGHRTLIRSLVVTADLRFVVSHADDGLRVWRTTASPTEPLVWVDASIDPLILLDPLVESITSVAFHPAGGRIAAGTADGRVVVWPTEDQGEPSRIAAHDAEVTDVAWGPDGEELVSADDSSARIWRLEGPRRAPERELDCAGEQVSALAVSPGARRYGLGCGDQVRVWTESSSEPQILMAAQGEGHVEALRFHPGGASLAAGSSRGIVRLWRLGSPPTSEAARVSGSVTSLAFDPMGRWLAVGTDAEERALTVLDTESLAKVFEAPAQWVTSVAFSADGADLATGSSAYAADYAASLWRWRRGDTRPVLLGHHRDWVTSVAFDPKGGRLVTGSKDSALRVWRIAFPDLIDHLRRVTAVCLRPDARERLLFERPAEARAAFERCERRHGRRS